LKKLEKNAKMPRICILCEGTFSDKPYLRSDKVFDHQRCQKWAWRHGVDAAPFMIIREEVEHQLRLYQENIATLVKMSKSSRKTDETKSMVDG
jgi:hypothetical protein